MQIAGTPNRDVHVSSRQMDPFPLLLNSLALRGIYALLFVALEKVGS
jgi:hypothetical protein